MIPFTRTVSVETHSRFVDHETRGDTPARASLNRAIVGIIAPSVRARSDSSLDDIVRASLQVQFLAARYLSSSGLFVLKELVLFFTQAAIVALRLPDPGSAAAWKARPDDLG